MSEEKKKAKSVESGCRRLRIDGRVKEKTIGARCYTRHEVDCEKALGVPDSRKLSKLLFSFHSFAHSVVSSAFPPSSCSFVFSLAHFCVPVLKATKRSA